jgi:hypothetical protein
LAGVSPVMMQENLPRKRPDRFADSYSRRRLTSLGTSILSVT